MLGIIGGTGLTQLSNLEVTHRQVVRTPYGEPSGALTFGRIDAAKWYSWRGTATATHIPPHMVNYRANIWALHAQKVTRVVSVASVGGIRADLGPGVIAVPHQIIDYTWGARRPSTRATSAASCTSTSPIPIARRCASSCLERGAARRRGHRRRRRVRRHQGPRLETAAEIDRLERDGADMVGMTGMPEAALARELGLCYAAVAVVANYAAGRAGSREGIRMEEINATLQTALGKVRSIIEKLVEHAWRLEGRSAHGRPAPAGAARDRSSSSTRPSCTRC